MLAGGLAAANAQSVQSPDFSLIALPDPQMYSEYFPETFQQQTAWIAAHGNELNIKFVIGLGDNVNDGDSETQWKNASEAMTKLDEAAIPYAMAIGNHDYLHSKPPTRSAPLFNQFFGKARYAGKNWFGETTYPAGTSENFYVTLPVEGEKYLLLFLEYFPRPAAVAWAKTVLGRYADHRVVVVTHAFEGSDAFRNGECDYNGPAAEGLESNTLNGEEVWESLVSQYPNVFLVLNGHVNGAARETDFGKHGNAVTQILADYQDDAEGGGGFLRILRFKPAQHQIEVKTYSPSSQSYKNDEQNSFTVPLDSSGLALKLAGIRGRVRSKECESLANATVTYSKGMLRERVFTDADGYFSTPTSLEPGTYRVTMNAAGFDPGVATVEVRAGFTTPVRLYLTKADREFTLAAVPRVEMQAGGRVETPVVVKRVGGFQKTIMFQVAGLPSGITGRVISAAKVSRLVLTAAPTTTVGKYKINVVASMGAMERVATVELEVTAHEGQ